MPPSKREVAYQVRLTQRAERDLDLLYDSVGAEHVEAALKWYRRLKRASCPSNIARFDAL